MFECGTTVEVAALSSFTAPAPVLPLAAGSASGSGKPFVTFKTGSASVTDGTLGGVMRLYAAAVAAMSPAERFTHRTGLPAVPEHGRFADPLTEDVARAAQARLVDSDRQARIADAHRTVALLDAYTTGMEDLRVRFGSQIGCRSGKGAQAFFATAGSKIGQHPLHVAHIVDTALVAKERLPKTWAVYLAGEATWRAPALAVKHAAGLDDGVWAAYDDEAARLVIGDKRLKDALRKLRERLQDDTAPQRARTAFEQRAVHLDPGPDGSATLSLTGPAVDLVAFDHGRTRAAVAAHGCDEAGRTVTQLRFDVARDLLLGGITGAVVPAPASATTTTGDDAGADAGPDAGTTDLQSTLGDATGDCTSAAGTATGVGVGAGADAPDTTSSATAITAVGWAVAVPQRKPVDVRLVLTIPALAWLGHSNEQAQLAGYGPIDLDTAKRLAGDAKSMVRVLSNPVTGVRTVMDRTVYAPPPDLRRWIQLRDQWCRFPGCRRPAHLCDIDHAYEWHEGGLTDAINLISLCRSHHDAKTRDLYQERLDDTGAVTWVDPWGNVLVDPTADPLDPAPTHLLTGTGTGTSAATATWSQDDDTNDEACPF